MTDEAMIENRTFDEIAVGESASVTRTLSKRDIQLFALVSGDVRSKPSNSAASTAPLAPTEAVWIGEKQ